MLSIKLADTWKDYEDVLNMLYEYICELHYIDECVEIRTKDELKREYFYGTNTLFYLEKENDIPVGFGIICVGDACHPLTDLYINEFYIVPEHRNKGYGKELFKYIAGDKKRICFYVLVKNTKAQNFWEHILKELNWKNVSNNYKDFFDDPALCWNVYENTER